jgi:hypothetical protein
MKQKFLQGSRVRVCKEMPDCMSHFHKDFEAIVEYTYSQAYGGSDIKSYSLLALDKEGVTIGSRSWYQENQLTLVSDDLKAGMEIMEGYNLKM